MAKKDFASGVKDLEVGVYSGLSRGALKAITSALMRERQGEI